VEQRDFSSQTALLEMTLRKVNDLS